MVTVEFLGPIGLPQMSAEACDLAQLKEVLKSVDGLQSWLVNCAVAVNDTLVSTLETKLTDGDKVSILPPVCGG